MKPHAVEHVVQLLGDFGVGLLREGFGGDFFGLAGAFAVEGEGCGAAVEDGDPRLNALALFERRYAFDLVGERLREEGLRLRLVAAHPRYEREVGSLHGCVVEIACSRHGILSSKRAAG